ncbi:hypothetical protein Tco_0455300 [Tanacetum coccineum]
MQDKSIAIIEFKETHRELQGKSVETQFNRTIVKQQFETPNLIAPGPLGIAHSMCTSVPREKVGSNDRFITNTRESKKVAQLQKDKDVKSKPSVITLARLPNTASGCKPKPRNWQASMSSRVSNKDVHLGDIEQKPFLKSMDCIKDAKSHKTTKEIYAVEKVGDSHGKLLTLARAKVDSEPTHVSILEIPIFMHRNNSGFKCMCQNGFTKDELHQMASAENNTSGPAFRSSWLMNSDHNHSELVFHGPQQ